MADRSRREELEKKRLKLQQLRDEKEKRRLKDSKVQHEPGEPKDRNKDLKDIDDILHDIDPSSLQSVSSTDASPPSITVTELSKSEPIPPKKVVQLTLVNLQATSIAPKESVTYEKQTQTQALGSDRGGPLDYYDNDFRDTLEWDDEFQVLTYDDIPGEDDGDGSLPFGTPPPSYHTAHHKLSTQTNLPHVEMVRPAQIPEETKPVEEKPPTKRREFSEEEKRHIMMTDEFQKFFDRASRITERALYHNESGDIFIDYTGAKEDLESEDKTGIKLILNRCFYNERWCKNRPITSFDWSSQYPELLATSYNSVDDNPNDPDGICLIWNMKFKKTTPEYIFHCQSPVTSSCFAKFHPNLIIGGTYSGQIVLWDNRSNKRSPVQRSPLSAASHTHPVYCIQVVGTQNAHNIISISTDGKLCSWSLDMLSQPQDTMELSQQKQSRPVAVSSMSFPLGDYNNFVIGSEEGCVYTACRHGTKAGILDNFEGHQGPVTSVDCHAVQSQIDFSHLFLTSSFDWTLKLWSTKETKPLYSFEDNCDYLYDVRWSPIHPALFASVDGMGRIDLWNLNNDTELPTVTATVEGCPALNRVIWTPNGNQVVVGDDMGKIWVYDVGEQLAQPKSDEATRFMHTLQELKNNNADPEIGDAGSDTYSSLSSVSLASFTSPLR